MPASPTPPSASGSFETSRPPEIGPKLLFDENLAPRLAGLLADAYPGSSSVHEEELQGTSDAVVWAHAASAAFVLVTKDEDFHRLSVLHGAPPKVVWIRLGNCSTAAVANLLRQHVAEVAAFYADAEAGFVALG